MAARAGRVLGLLVHVVVVLDEVPGVQDRDVGEGLVRHTEPRVEQPHDHARARQAHVVQGQDVGLLHGREVGAVVQGARGGFFPR